MKRRLPILLTLLLSFYVAAAQDTDTHAFIKHKVRWMETLYSISRKYRVPSAVIVQTNRLQSEEVVRNQLLVIPVTENTRVKKAKVIKLRQPVIHIVQQGETLSSIADRYGVTEISIKKLNADAFCHGRITTGAPLLIELFRADRPEEKPAESPEDRHIPCTRYKPDPGYRHSVSLLLPLNTAQPQAPESQPYISFYEGSLLAVKDMKEKGMSLDLSCYDLTETPCEQLLNSGKLDRESLLIGPVFSANLGAVLQHFKDSETKIVSPLDPSAEKWLARYGHFFQVQPSAKVKREALVARLKPQEATVWLLYESGRDTLTVSQFRKILREAEIPFREYAYKVLSGREASDHLYALMCQAKANQVIVASTQEAFVSDALRNLQLLLIYKDVPIEVFGLAAWRNFETLDLKALHELKVQMVLPVFVDYADPKVKSFISLYRKYYNREPDVYAFQGYDVCYYFLNALFVLGPDFQNCIENFDMPRLLQSDYKFGKDNPDGGYSNHAIRPIRYNPDFSVQLQ